MRRKRLVPLAALTAMILALGSGPWDLFAQEQKPRLKLAESSPVARPGVEEAMSHRFDFPFAEPTPLDAVAKHFQKELGAEVVLDLAALKRLGVTPETLVKLDLKNVRLKTGLKLLLDQAGLMVKVVAEDNLLVFTDERGSDDPSTRIYAELKELHRDIHDLRNALDDLTRMIGMVEEGGPTIRKPTIIEDIPADKDKDKGKGDEPAGRSRPGL